MISFFSVKKRKPATWINHMNPKVVLDASVVKRYMCDTHAEAAVTIDLHDSPNEVGELDESIIFVCEDKPPELTPKSQVVLLQKENKKQQQRIRNLEIHVGALQKTLLCQATTHTIEIEDEASESEVAKTQETESEPVECETAEVAEIDMNNSMIDADWVNDQIAEIRVEGNLTMMAAEIELYLGDE